MFDPHYVDLLTPGNATRADLAGFPVGLNNRVFAMQDAAVLGIAQVALASRFAFMVSFDEIVIALYLAGPGLTTMSVKMWLSMQFSVDPTIAAVSTMVTGLSVVLFIAMAEMRRRSNLRRAGMV
jgi:hypothetical protein